MDTTDTPRDSSDYPAHGKYNNVCARCKEAYRGYKRSIVCDACGGVARAEWDALSEGEKITRAKSQVEAINSLIKYYKE